MTVDQAMDYVRFAFANGRLAQAYVIEGPVRGEGSELATRMTSLLYCTAGDAKPCGTCPACRRVADHAHADVLWVEPQKKSRLISVDQVRALRARMLQTAFEGGWKTVLIVGADRLGDEAANAFLKVLEEPPGRSLFLLLTDAPQFLLPTVSSRCQRMMVGRESLGLPPDWHDRLLAVLAAEGGRWPVLEAQAAAARLESLFKLVQDEARRIETEQAEAAVTEEEKDTIEARVLARYRELRATVLRAMLAWCRDELVLLCGGDEKALYYPEKLDVLRIRASGLTLRRALDRIKAVEVLNQRLARFVPDGAALVDLMTTLRNE